MSDTFNREDSTATGAAWTDQDLIDMWAPSLVTCKHIGAVVSIGYETGTDHVITVNCPACGLNGYMDETAARELGWIE